MPYLLLADARIAFRIHKACLQASWQSVMVEVAEAVFQIILAALLGSGEQMHEPPLGLDSFRVF